jgi:hypothetical protein
MKYVIRGTAAATLALALAACAQPVKLWAPASPAKSTADFEVDRAKCDLMAQQVTPGQVAAGPLLFVAAAAAAHNSQIGHNFDNCMVIAGWRRTS